MTFLDVTKATQVFGGGQQSFTQKLIDVQITLGASNTNQPSTFSGGGNTVTLSGHRVSAHIVNTGGADNHALVSIWGLSQSTMNELSQLGMIYNQIRKNSIVVSAGDPFSGMSVVYGSDIMFAYADYNQMPEVPMVFDCRGGALGSVISRAPTTLKGSQDVATLMQQWAGFMGLRFENNGVTGLMVANPYYAGNVWQRIQALAADVGINAQIVEGGTLAIWPKGKSRSNLTVPLISPTTGMIGYPAYQTSGFAVIRYLFNPAVRLGGQIQVQSSLPLATRSWDVYMVNLTLESLMPHGAWEGAALCYPSGFPAPIASSL